MNEETEQKINQLQMIEYNMHNLSSQRQQFHAQLLEVESAIGEVKKKEKCFKIIGNIMIETKNEELGKDLEEKKEKLDLRIKHVEKQEKSLKEKADKIQKEVMSEMKS